MPEMHSTFKFSVHMPHATSDEMRHGEALMRDQTYHDEALAALNKIANRHAKAAGFKHKIEMTGHIVDVHHVV